jgi:hypothetical protein
MHNQQGGKTPAVSKGGAAPKAGGLSMGQFAIEPSEGCLEPGAKCEVSVVFNAEGAQVYRCEVWMCSERE